MAIATVNPANGETIRTFDPESTDELERKISLAAETFATWRRTPFAGRSSRMLRLAGLLEGRAGELGRLMTLEMGKPLGAAVAEANKCALACRFYAENAEALLADELVETSASRSFITYQPLGVVLAIMPWNFPFWQVLRFAAPGLMAGNVALLKHASNVPQCALAIEQLFRESGFEDGVFQTLLIGSDQVARVIEDDRIAAVTLTGSEGAGRDVGQRAAAKIKKVVLELGGSDPFIVMPSADLDAAVATGVKARTINNGQSCIAAKRFIVHRDIAAEFTRRFVETMERLTIGDPMDESTEIGPLVSEAGVEEIEKQVQATVAAGATLLTGGKRLDRKGWFFPPTVLAEIPSDAIAAREELFGPVASIFVVDDIDDAIRVANSTRFGLGSSAWTSDEAERARFIEGIEAGQVFINAMVASDPHLPFGGVKASGIGRELGEAGLKEFVNVKTVWIE
jgi:succinate-semialdehyde dehydrogenase / glutarate-semialdehyde dehydrogenase